MGAPGGLRKGRDDSRNHDDPQGEESQKYGDDDARQGPDQRILTHFLVLQGYAVLPVNWGSGLGGRGWGEPPSHHPSSPPFLPQLHAPTADSAPWLLPTPLQALALSWGLTPHLFLHFCVPGALLVPQDPALNL